MRHRLTADPTAQRGELARRAGSRAGGWRTSGSNVSAVRSVAEDSGRRAGSVPGVMSLASRNLEQAHGQRSTVNRRRATGNGQRATGDLWQESSRRRNQLDGMSFPKVWFAARCGPPRTPQHSPRIKERATTTTPAPQLTRAHMWLDAPAMSARRRRPLVARHRPAVTL
jgi:hypothetical protein